MLFTQQSVKKSISLNRNEVNSTNVNKNKCTGLQALSH